MWGPRYDPEGAIIRSTHRTYLPGRACLHGRSAAQTSLPRSPPNTPVHRPPAAERCAIHAARRSPAGSAHRPPDATCDEHIRREFDVRLQNCSRIQWLLNRLGSVLGFGHTSAPALSDTQISAHSAWRLASGRLLANLRSYTHTHTIILCGKGSGEEAHLRSQATPKRSRRTRPTDGLV